MRSTCSPVVRSPCEADHRDDAAAGLKGRDPQQRPLWRCLQQHAPHFRRHRRHVTAFAPPVTAMIRDAVAAKTHGRALEHRPITNARAMQRRRAGNPLAAAEACVIAIKPRLFAALLTSTGNPNAGSALLRRELALRPTAQQTMAFRKPLLRIQHSPRLPSGPPAGPRNHVGVEAPDLGRRLRYGVPDQVGTRSPCAGAPPAHGLAST